MPVAYVMSHYPAVSHAFLLREVRALRRHRDTATISIHRARPADLLSGEDRDEAARTFSVLPVGAAALLGAHLRALRGDPGAYVRALGRAWALATPGLRGRLWSLFHFAEAMVVWRHCRRLGVRHLHAQFADAATDVALLVCAYEPGWTWSLAVHGPVEFYDVTLHRLRAKLASASFAVAISDFGRSQLMTLVPAERWDRLHVVRCGVEPARFGLVERPEHPGPLRILCVGRLVDVKGQAILLDALARLGHAGHEATLTLVGAGPGRRGLEDLAARRGLTERVAFAGAVGQDEILEHYIHADVLCLPSFAEGLPVVLMEALATGLPVVTTRIMGIPELVQDGVNGRLVAPGRPDALAAALAELADQPELRAAMGRAGRRTVEREFDVERSAAALDELFATATNRR